MANKIDANEYTRLVVEKFEGNFAICSTKSGAQFELDIDLIDKNVKQGDTVECKNGVYVTVK